MGFCLFRARLNQLNSIWYTTLNVLVQLYLLYLGLERYRLYANMKWPHGAYPRVWLTVYVFLLAVCIPLLVLFTAFGVFKSGNLAGDNEQLGARPERIIELSKKVGRNDRRSGKRFCFSICHCTKSIWLHSPPLPQSIHLVLALCQLFAQQIMLAQLYRFGFINSGDFLNTELDFLYQKSRQLATNLPMGDTRLQGFRITSEELTDSPMAPNLLPILMHARLFGIPLEFVNFLVAIVAYSCAYPSVFWRVSKTFSLCFSLHLIVHTITIIWSYLAFSILFRVQETNYYSVRPVGIGQHLWFLRPIIVYHPLAIIGTFVLTICMMQISPISLYNYGYNKHLASIYSFQRSRSSHPSTTTQLYMRDNGVVPPSQMCCDGYGPHISAIFILIFVVAIKSPTLYALTLLYQHEEKPVILSCIVIDVVYLFTWIILWLFLTLKRDWTFKVVHDVQEILSLQDATRTADGNIQNKTITDLKNSLILMHKGHLFVTDDPLAKPSIMRHVLKSCVQDDIYWLRANQSPANRKTPLEECNVVSRETGQLFDSAINSRKSTSSPPVPLAAPPYQRLGSLPPQSSPMHNHSHVVNSFGTLQRGMGNNNELAHRSLPPINSCTLGHTHNYNQMPYEVYASIHRNSGSSRGGGAGNYGVLKTIPGQTFTLEDQEKNRMVSPQLMRHVRGGSVTTSREVIIGGPATTGRDVANYGNQTYASSCEDKKSRISSSSGGYMMDTHKKCNFDVDTRQGSIPMIVRNAKNSINSENRKQRNYELTNSDPIYESKEDDNAKMISFSKCSAYRQSANTNGQQNNSGFSANHNREVSDTRLSQARNLTNGTNNANAQKPPIATQPAIWNSAVVPSNAKIILNHLEEICLTPSPSTAASSSVSSNMTCSTSNHHDRRSNFSATTQTLTSTAVDNSSRNGGTDNNYLQPKSSSSTLTKNGNSLINGNDAKNRQLMNGSKPYNYSNENCIETYDNAAEGAASQWTHKNYTTKMTFDSNKDVLEEFATSVV